MFLAGLGRRQVQVVVLLLLSAGAQSACLGQSCTLVGCENQLLVRVTPEQAWKEGTYELQLTRDDLTTNCSFALPDDLPGQGRVKPLDCGSDAAVDVQQLLTCTSMTSKDGNSGSGSCVPVPDRYQLTLELAGNPRQVTLTLARDGEAVLDDSRAPHYSRAYPNGSECDDGCTQGGFDLTFED